MENYAFFWAIPKVESGFQKWNLKSKSGIWIPDLESTDQLLLVHPTKNTIHTIKNTQNTSKYIKIHTKTVLFMLK